MKRALQQLIRVSPETEDQFEATAQFLEDLALHADHDIERCRCQKSLGEQREAEHKPQGTNERHEAEVMRPESVLLRSFGERGASVFVVPSVLEKQFREGRMD